MVSQRVKQILVSKGAPFADAEIDSMTDAEGWAWIYAQPKKKAVAKGEEVCFTGFSPQAKKELMTLAGAAGLHVAKTVTKGLAYLCAGETAGPAKRAKAEAQGARIISEDEFRMLCEIEGGPS